MSPIRIIMTNHSNIFGGAERHSVLLAKALAEMGHRVVFVCPKKSWTWKALEETPVRMVSLPLNGTCDLYSFVRLLVLAKKTGAQILHGHLTRSAHYVNWVSRFSGIPSVVTAHATNTHKHFKGARRIIAVSMAVKEHLLEKGYEDREIEVVYSGVEDTGGFWTPMRQKIRSSLDLSEDEVAIVHLGRFIKDKGQDITLKAVSLIKDRPFRLFFIGGHDTGWGEEIKDLVKRYGLHEKVIFLGHREDARQILTGMDIMVQPSRREALGLSVIEALSAGIPVVASRIGGIPEAIRDGMNGFLFEPEDFKALADILKYLIDNPEVRERLSENARRTYLERFSIERMIEDTLRVYEKVIKEAR